MTQPKLFDPTITLLQLESHLWEAAIGLAPNLFYGTGLAACILVLRRRKKPEKAGPVLIVDASSLFRKGRAQNFLDPEHAATILGWVHDYTDVPDRARVVSVEEIAAEDWTLNISRYVLPHIGETSRRCRKPSLISKPPWPACARPKRCSDKRCWPGDGCKTESSCVTIRVAQAGG